MKDKIFMSANNAEVVVGIPLFRINHGHAMVSGVQAFTKHTNTYAIIVTDQKPLAYVLDAGKWREVCAAEWVEKKLICLGEL